MPKAGSSALQATLTKAHPDLLRKGVLYPLSEFSNHNFLVAGILPYERLPRRLKHAYSARRDRLTSDVERYWSRILAQIRHHKPHTVVLSGESFFRELSDDQVSKLNALLRPWAKDLEIVIYVRRPSEYFLSSVQQKLRAAHGVRGVGAVKYRGTIDRYRTRVADKLHVIPFNRRRLYHTDIASDFAWRFIPDCLDEVESAVVGAVNETVSAESMSVLQSYRLVNHPDREDIPTPDTQALIKLLRNIERDNDQFSRPKLRPEVAAAVESKSMSEVAWLEANFGVSFEKLTTPEANSPAMDSTLMPIDSICEVDPEKRDRLLMLTLHRALGHNFHGKRSRRYLRWAHRHLTNVAAKILPGIRRSNQTG
jgi:hypothetical protein